MPMGPLWSEHAYVRTSSGEAARGRASLLVLDVAREYGRLVSVRARRC